MTGNKPNATQSKRPCSNNAAQTITQNLERMDIASHQVHSKATTPRPSPPSRGNRKSSRAPSAIVNSERNIADVGARG